MLPDEMEMTLKPTWCGSPCRCQAAPTHSDLFRFSLEIQKEDRYVDIGGGGKQWDRCAIGSSPNRAGNGGEGSQLKCCPD